MDISPVFQSLPLSAFPSLGLCVLAGSLMKLRASCCLRGFVCCSQTSCMGSFWTRLDFKWLNYHSDRDPWWTVACLLHEGGSFLSFKKRSLLYLGFISERRADASRSIGLLRSLCLSLFTFVPVAATAQVQRCGLRVASTLGLLSSHQLLAPFVYLRRQEDCVKAA